MDFTKLYTKRDKGILKVAEDALNPNLNRVQEIIEYARMAEISIIGVAHCTAVKKEADQLEKILIDEGFTVNKVNCKYGKVPFSSLVKDYKGLSCNPAGQAQYLAEKETELNVMLGLCLGHDMIFNSKSKAPVTPLIVKDRKLKHNTISALQQPDNN